MGGLRAQRKFDGGKVSAFLGPRSSVRGGSGCSSTPSPGPVANASAARRPSDRWSADAAYAVRIEDLDADTVVVLVNGGPVQTPTTVSFDGVQSVLSGSVSYEISSILRPRLGASGVATTGDAEVRYGALVLDLPCKIRSDLTLGAEIDLHHFDSRGSSLGDDYDSTALLLYVKTGF